MPRFHDVEDWNTPQHQIVREFVWELHAHLIKEMSKSYAIEKWKEAKMKLIKPNTFIQLVCSWDWWAATKQLGNQSSWCRQYIYIYIYTYIYTSVDIFLLLSCITYVYIGLWPFNMSYMYNTEKQYAGTKVFWFSWNSSPVTTSFVCAL